VRTYSAEDNIHVAMNEQPSTRFNVTRPNCNARLIRNRYGIALQSWW